MSLYKQGSYNYVWQPKHTTALLDIFCVLFIPSSGSVVWHVVCHFHVIIIITILHIFFFPYEWLSLNTSLVMEIAM